MADQSDQKNFKQYRNKGCGRIVCCSHGQRCSRAQSPSDQVKETNALPSPKRNLPKRMEQSQAGKTSPDVKTAKVKRRSYFQEMNQFSMSPLNTEMSVTSMTSMCLPSVSSLTLEFRKGDVSRKYEGLRTVPQIVNEKIQAKPFEDTNDEISKLLLKSLYIGCKTMEEAEKMGQSPSLFCLYHRKRETSAGNLMDLLKPLQLFLLYTRANGQPCHKEVAGVEEDNGAVVVSIKTSEDHEAISPFPNSADFNSKTSVSNSRSVSIFSSASNTSLTGNSDSSASSTSVTGNSDSSANKSSP